MANYRYDEIRKVMIAKTIVESGSIQKAARVLKVTPSAVSQSLSSLEKKIGQALFVREKGALRPTSECLQLLERAEPAFRAMDQIFVESKALQIDYLDLGAYESIAHSVLPSFVRKIRQKHPQVKLNLLVSRTAELIKKVRKGELCTALVVETDGMDSLKQYEVAREELGIFISRDLAHIKDDWEAILRLGFGFLSVAADGIPPYLKRFLRQLGARPPVTITSDSFEVLRRAAAAGVAAALLPKRVAARHDDLVEVTHFRGEPKSEKGEHRILLVTFDRCDVEEAEYLTEIVRDCFK